MYPGVIHKETVVNYSLQLFDQRGVLAVSDFIYAYIKL